MAHSTEDTDRTGWAKARIPLNWSEEHPVEDGEWTECEPPQSEREDRSLDLDDDKIRQAEEDAARVNEMIGR